MCQVGRFWKLTSLLIPCDYQAVERETENADQIHAQERLQHQAKMEELEHQITEWKVKCFDEQYERWAKGSA